MKKYGKKLTAWVLALTMALTMTGYAAASGSATKKTTDADESKKAAQIIKDVLDLTEKDLDALPCIGEKTKNCSTIVLRNDTEGNITAINIKASTDAAWSDNILAEDYVFAAGETALLCWETQEDTLYDLQLTFADWTVGVAHDVNFADTPGAQLHRQWNGLPYLVYVSLSSGEDIDTSSAEQARAEAEIAAGTWAYGNGETSSSSGSSGSSGGGWSSGSSGSSGGGSSSGGGCLDDALFW